MGDIEENKLLLPKTNTASVKIRIWGSDLGFGPGHVSLETNNLYISFWPGKNEKNERINKGLQGKFNILSEDLTRENDRQPDYIYILELDKLLELECAFIAFKESAPTWKLIGNRNYDTIDRILIDQKGIDPIQNCSGLVTQLIAIGSTKFIAIRDRSRDKTCINFFALIFFAFGGGAEILGITKKSDGWLSIGGALIAIGMMLFAINICYKHIYSIPQILQATTPDDVRDMLEKLPNATKTSNSLHLSKVEKVKKVLAGIDYTNIYKLKEDLGRLAALVISCDKSKRQDTENNLFQHHADPVEELKKTCFRNEPIKFINLITQITSNLAGERDFADKFFESNLFSVKETYPFLLRKEELDSLFYFEWFAELIKVILGRVSQSLKEHYLPNKPTLEATSAESASAFSMSLM